MNETKYLAKNIGFLTISQFGTKLLSFFLVPLYTSVLTTSDYGTYDLFTVTISLMIPIFTSNIADSSLRFALEKTTNKNQILSISIKFFSRSLIFFFITLVINRIFNIFSIVNDYAFLLFIMFAINAINGIMTNFSRGIDRVKDMAISGGICSVVMVCLNILFLIPLHMGLMGYFLANIFGTLSQSIYLFVAIKAWKYFDFKEPNSLLRKEMLNFSKPLIANNISWWVNSVSDRYIVTWLSGVAQNGIYSVGYKIPSILSIFQTIFNQAWTLSVVRDFDPEDSDGFFTNMYNLYNFCIIFICSTLIITTRFLAYILYAQEFFTAWRYVPFLLIAIVFGALSGYIGGIFTAVKDPKIFAQSTMIGATVNIILNLCLVSIIGPLGAAFSTAISYWITWVLRMICVKKYIKMKLNLVRDCFAYSILLIQSFLLFVFENESIKLYLIESLLLVILMIIYKEEIKKIFFKVIHIVSKT